MRNWTKIRLADLSMAKPQLPQQITVKHERSSAFRAVIVDSVSTAVFSDQFSDRVTVSFGRNENRVLSERATRTAEGQIQYIGGQLETGLFKVVEFDALMTPQAAIDLIRGITSALKGLGKERRERLGLDIAILGLTQVFDL